MASINTLRALLVGGAVVAAVVAAAYGLWVTVGIMAVAVVVHGLLTLQLRRASDASAVPTVPPAGSPPTTGSP